jgi:hypothetical protein
MQRRCGGVCVTPCDCAPCLQFGVSKSAILTVGDVHTAASKVDLSQPQAVIRLAESSCAVFSLSQSGHGASAAWRTPRVLRAAPCLFVEWSLMLLRS